MELEQSEAIFNQVLCRLCAKSTQEYVDIFLEEHQLLLNNIFEIFKTELCQEEGLHNVCLNCIENVQNFYPYYCTVLKAQDYIKGLIVSECNQQIIEVAFLETSSDGTETVQPGFDTELIEVNYEQQSDEVLCDKNNSRNASSDIKVSTISEIDTVEFLKKSTIKRTKYCSSAESKSRDQAINTFFHFICNSCSFVTDRWRTLYGHYRKLHEIRFPTVQCCNKRIQLVQRELYGHVQFHKDPEKLRCSYCSMQCYTIKQKEAHEKRHKLSQMGAPLSNHKKRKCEICGIVLCQLSNYNSHLKTHLPPEERESHKFVCDYDKRKFCTKRALLEHMQKTHNCEISNFRPHNSELIICHLCGKSFTNTLAYTSHYHYHHKDQHERIKCPECGLEIRKRLFKSHLIRKHSSIQENCDICGKAFPNVLSLNNHKKRVHVEASYECEICKKKFKQNDNLKEHRYQHQGILRFYCDQCNYSNNEYSAMSKHRKSNHPNAPALAFGTARKTFMRKCPV